MKKFLLATTALAMSGVAASAADLPSRKGPPIAPAYIPAFTWTGFYVGLNAGVGWANNNNSLPGGAFPAAGFVSTNSNQAGFVGGAQAGTTTSSARGRVSWSAPRPISSLLT